MSYANVKSFILILLLAVVNCRVIRMNNQANSNRNYGSSSGSRGSGNGAFSGKLSGYGGLADIGVNINEMNGAGAGAGAGGFGGIGNVGATGFGDIGLGDLTSGGNNLWSEFQGIIGSVGGVGSSSSIGDIGLTSNDFNFGPGSSSSSLTGTANGYTN